MRVLIVEDEEALTTLLRYNLEAEGFSVDAAARGDEAELLLAERTPDLVLLDWMLPGCPASNSVAASAPAGRPSGFR